MQAVIDGILLGGIYALIGVAFSLLYGVMNMLNIAHGAFIMLGAYVTFWAFELVGLDPFVSIPLSMVVLFVVGYVIQKAIINRVLGANVFTVMLLTYGLSIVIINVALLVWTANFRSVSPDYAHESVRVGELIFPVVRVAAFAVAVLLTGLLVVFMERTATGQAIQATALDREAAQAVGIDINRIYQLVFALSAALAAAAGSLIALIVPINPQMGITLTFKAFIVAVLGGLGGMYGALAGGLLLGIAEVIGGTVLGVSYQNAIGLIVLLVVLVVRPQGLFGRRFFSEVAA